MELPANSITEIDKCSRRNFIEKSLKVTMLSGIAGSAAFAGCSEQEEKKVSPPEDLMQEHGLLNRVLLIYDSCKVKLLNEESFDQEILFSAASIIKKFVEDYHEKQEENYLFARFEKMNQQTELVQILREQHIAGRKTTSQILQLTKQKNLNEDENKVLIRQLENFVRMYRPHEAREDTVLFPAFRKMISKNEYDSIGEEFEKNEHRLFGKDGFETIVNEVKELEKKTGIYELNQFTPI